MFEFLPGTTDLYLLGLGTQAGSIHNGGGRDRHIPGPQRDVTGHQSWAQPVITETDEEKNR